MHGLGQSFIHVMKSALYTYNSPIESAQFSGFQHIHSETINTI